jgi:hypothetical protein
MISALTSQVAPKSSVKLTMLLASSSRQAGPVKNSAASKWRSRVRIPRGPVARLDGVRRQRRLHGCEEASEVLSEQSEEDGHDGIDQGQQEERLGAVHHDPLGDPEEDLL